MTAAKVMNIISRLPGCAEQAADAVSAYTQAKMEDAHKLLKIPNRSVQTFGYVYRNTNGQNHGPEWNNQLFFLNGICTVTLWQDYYGNGNFEKVLLTYGWEKVPNRECLFVNREKGLFLSVYENEKKLDGKKQSIYPIWKILMNDVELGEPTSFLDHVYLGCTQRECQISKDIVHNRISTGATEKLPEQCLPKTF